MKHKNTCYFKSFLQFNIFANIELSFRKSIFFILSENFNFNISEY